MAIISAIGRKSMKVRALYFLIYGILTIGSITMIYPFLLMISGSTKSNVDIKKFDAIPKFLYDDSWLYKKQMESLFNEVLSDYNYSYSNVVSSFEYVNLPEGNPLLVKEMSEFIKGKKISTYFYGIGALHTPQSKTIPSNLRKFKEMLQSKYGEDINEVNEAIGTEYMNWNSIKVLDRSFYTRREKPYDTTYFFTLSNFKLTIPLGERFYYSPIGYYRKAILMNDYSRYIEEYNEEHKTKFVSYNDVMLPRRLPSSENKLTQDDWTHYVRDIIGLQYLKVDKSVAPAYREFLKVKHSTIENLNKNYNTSYKSFDEIPFIDEPVFEGMVASDWNSFMTGWLDPVTGKMFIIPIETIEISCLDFDYQDEIEKKYETIANVNSKLGTNYASFKEILLPQQAMNYAYFKKNNRALKMEFVTRNYKAVADYIIFHGRGIFNTVVYCILAVLSAVVINPLAAYAMSRYKLPSTYKILLFMLCTMAFPPMVTAIPNFLMLRNLGLLNTFAALLLPGLANGYAIFLLKGFFDSHPQELYECAELDGASEWIIFWHITMSLSKPILAVIALQAFNLAYSNFMFAFVVCQDEKMWTLMVWLYQLQQNSGQAVMYASLIIAAVPTFLIFLFCQNIIMRGIVVPSEK